jgi:hypothetical protein
MCVHNTGQRVVQCTVYASSKHEATIESMHASLSSPHNCNGRLAKKDKTKTQGFFLNQYSRCVHAIVQQSVLDALDAHNVMVLHLLSLNVVKTCNSWIGLKNSANRVELISAMHNVKAHLWSHAP